MNIVFLGSDAIALPALNWIAGEGTLGDGAAGLRIIGVITQPDRPSGRGQVLSANPIKRWALERGLPVRQPEKLGEADVAWLREMKTDLSLVMAYGQILGEAFLAAPAIGTLNLHASILPSYRGASPIQAAIAAGDKVTGVCLMRLVRRLDAGPVAALETVPIAPLDTAAEIEPKIAAACIPLLGRALPALAAGTLAFAEQDVSRATYCRRLSKEDGVLDFSAPAGILAARINALHPWPSCTVEARGFALRLGSAEPVETSAAGALPGSVLGRDGSGLLVATGSGALRLLRLQRPGGRMLPAPEFLRGFPIGDGTVLPSHPMPPLVTAQPVSRPAK